MILEEEGTRLPGAKRFALREAAEEDGIIVDSGLIAQIRKIVSGDLEPHPL